jgi:hypothetical protein
MTTQVNGGIITDQMLAGKLLYFKMTGAFAWTVSDGTVTLDSPVTGGATPATTYFTVGEDRPVPGSLANWALEAIMEKCTVVDIGVIGAPGAETEIDFSVDGTAFGWITPVLPDGTGGDVDVVAMQDAIAAIGATLTVPVSAGAAGAPPVTANVSTTVAITQVPFELA